MTIIPRQMDENDVKSTNTTPTPSSLVATVKEQQGDRSVAMLKQVYKWQARIQQDPKNEENIPSADATSIATIVKAMEVASDDTTLITAGLEIFLAMDIEHDNEIKTLFVSGGALQRTLTVMKEHAQYPLVQSIALHCLAKVSQNANDTIKNDHLLPIVTPIVHNVMKEHILHVRIQRYGCSLLRNLSNPLLQELVAAGSLAFILNGMKEHPKDALLHEHGNAALYNLLTVCPDCMMNNVICNPHEMNAIATIVEGMKQNTEELQVQKYGLLVLTRVSTKSKANYELILSNSGGLEVIVMALSTFGESCEDIAQIGCQLLKNFSRQSLDIQRIITAKGGVSVILNIMRKQIPFVTVQDPALACLRNMCTHPDNLRDVALDGGISTILATMSIYREDSAIQAYGCDALGRLAVDQSNTIAIYKENGIAAAIEAMKEHQHHAGVQDRAIFLLLGLSQHEPALTSMRDDNILPLLLEAKVPPKEEAVDRLQKLIRSVEGLTGWLFRRTRFHSS